MEEIIDEILKNKLTKAKIKFEEKYKSEECLTFSEFYALKYF